MEEWDQQASSSSDLGKQVARPSGLESLTSLVENIGANLDLDETVQSILDVGCGNALVLSQVAGATPDVYGVDYSRSMIEKAKELMPHARFSVGQAQPLEFDDDKFHRVLSYSIFHYFPDDEYCNAAISEFIRICRPGGVILVGDLLDKQFEAEIKGGSDKEIEKRIPGIHRYSGWRFYDLDRICSYCRSLGKEAEILVQPPEFPFSSYRKDIRIHT